MNLTSHHPKISSLVLPFLQGIDSAPGGTNNAVVLKENLTDYGGTRFRVEIRRSVSPESNHDGSSGNFTVLLHVSLHGWDLVQSDAIPALKSTFGQGAVALKKDNSDFVVSVDSNKLPTGQTAETCADLLSQVRVLAVGAPLRAAFDSLAVSGGNANTSAEEGNPLIVLPLQKPTPNGQKSTCYLASFPGERVTVVFNVDFHDETDRALARLFLSHFVEAQRKSANNAPLCDYRRGTDPPREVASTVDKNQHDEEEKKSRDHDTSGFLSFTFLRSHVDTVEKRTRAVGLLVVFLTYIDGHVKASKAHMNMRMHQKANDLLDGLKA